MEPNVIYEGNYKHCESERIKESDSDIRELIDTLPFFNSQSESLKNDFCRLAVGAGRLAIYNAGEILIVLNEAACEIEIFLSAPSFFMNTAHLPLLHAICLSASDMAVSNEQDDVLIIITFDFASKSERLVDALNRILPL